MPRPPQPLEPDREERLLTAALAAFAADGFAGASLNGILDAAGMAKSSFYHYFSDKEALYRAVVDSLRARMLEPLPPPDLDALTAATFWPAMADVVTTLQAGAARHPELALLGRLFHRSEEGEPDAVMSGLRAAVLGWIGRAVDVGRAVGAVRDDLPGDLVCGLAIAVLLRVDEWVLFSAAIDTERRAVGIRVTELVRDLIGAGAAE